MPRVAREPLCHNILHRCRVHACSRDELDRMLVSSCGRILRHQPPVLLKDFGCGISSHHAIVNSVQQRLLKSDSWTANAGRAAAAGGHISEISMSPWLEGRCKRATVHLTLCCCSCARSFCRLLCAGPAAKSPAWCPRGSDTAYTCCRADCGTNVCRQVYGVVAACQALGGEQARAITLSGARFFQQRRCWVWVLLAGTSPHVSCRVQAMMLCW